MYILLFAAGLALGIAWCTFWEAKASSLPKHSAINTNISEPIAVLDSQPEQTNTEQGFVEETVWSGIQPRYDWGYLSKGERMPLVLDMMRQYSRANLPRWWSGEEPTNIEWAGYLLVREGGYWAQTPMDCDLMGWLILYKVTQYGPTEFTPATNPSWDMVFDESDWSVLTAPIAEYEDAISIIRRLAENGKETDPPPYLFTATLAEVTATEEAAGREIKYVGPHRVMHFQGELEPLYLFAYYSDFACAEGWTPPELCP